MVGDSQVRTNKHDSLSLARNIAAERDLSQTLWSQSDSGIDWENVGMSRNQGN